MCAGTGYKGRSPVHEIMPITPTIARMITEREQVETLREASGFVSMQREAIDMALEGRTSLAEAQRTVFFSNESVNPAVRHRVAA